MADVGWHTNKPLPCGHSKVVQLFEDKGAPCTIYHIILRDSYFYTYRLEFLFSTIIFKVMRNKNVLIGGIDDQNMMYVFGCMCI